ncbi:MAG: ethanolamine transporter EutH [Candidatus Paceibacteria bacterium]|jgi:ethanolamine transporter EutH
MHVLFLFVSLFFACLSGYGAYQFAEFGDTSWLAVGVVSGLYSIPFSVFAAIAASKS